MLSETIEGHIRKAKLFHAHWPTGQLPLEWTITAIYYETLHWLSAEVIQLHLEMGWPEPDISTHARLREAMHLVFIPGHLRRHYLHLEALSRRARYATAPADQVTNSDVGHAVQHFTALEEWIRQELNRLGYDC